MKRKLLLLLILPAFLASCKGSAPQTEGIPAASHRSVYYWKTVFNIGDGEMSFLREHKIDRIYLRMFDVDVLHSYVSQNDYVEPVATVKFETAKPDSVEIVPVVFITLDALKHYVGKEEELASKIVGRVLNICSYNDLGQISEVQFDCDWTGTTRQSFDRLCASAKEILHPEGILLSGTIRLHQIEEAEYPFDRGVLMLYNTGSIMNPLTANSILHYNDVEKYLGVEKRIAKFLKARKSNCKTIDYAYPTYGWNVVFNDEGRFVGILPQMDLDSAPDLKFMDGRYVAEKDCCLGNKYIYKGSTIRPEHSDIDEVLKVKSLVDKTFGGAGSNIVYHFDMSNLSKYTFDDVEKILD